MSGFKRASSILEYCILITVFCTALVGMQIYLKRAVQGELKAHTDSIGGQFSSAWSDYTYTTKITSKRQETITPQGEIESTLLEPFKTIRSAYVDDFSDKKLTEEGLFE